MRALLRGALDLLLPPACAACGAAPPGSAALCAACDAALPRIPEGRCVLCQAAPPGAGGCCAACPRGPLGACVAAVRFEGDVEGWIHRFKYPGPGLGGLDPAARAVVRDWVREAAARMPGPAPARVIPVPLHPRRLRRRGFNPAALLARSVGRALGVPVDPVGLVRLRDTESQTGLGRAARRRNVRGAFAARARRPLPERVWLVDDVVTTGSTLREAAAALRRAGVREVAAVCAARTPA